MTGSRNLIAPADELRQVLDSGTLLTPWAQEQCGQPVLADVERSGPPYLHYDEAALLGLTRDDNWACLRRAGRLVQQDGTEVARVTSVVALSRVSPETVRLLQTTRTPLGLALGPEAASKVLWCSAGICEYAVACGRLILVRGEPAALTTDWVLWSWLGSVR
jgi:hypothetical protein